MATNSSHSISDDVINKYSTYSVHYKDLQLQAHCALRKSGNEAPIVHV